ncbi:hypothetical protein GCM10007047_25560 [Cerasicoccus arenae]|uniref:Uncharacterized protein n=1 Tax=Cerasicoccus arenae TaxID=424488 RepID=A0A8J3DIP0_9BACT|nr:hypothetical protein GCM10007047_25560 [Cerasicoccus arenae]
MNKFQEFQNRIGIEIAEAIVGIPVFYWQNTLGKISLRPTAPKQKYEEAAQMTRSTQALIGPGRSAGRVRNATMSFSVIVSKSPNSPLPNWKFKKRRTSS